MIVGAKLQAWNGGFEEIFRDIKWHDEQVWNLLIVAHLRTLYIHNDEDTVISSGSVCRLHFVFAQECTVYRVI